MKKPVLLEKFEISERGKARRGRFRCECGNEFESAINNVTSGQVQSCGCLKWGRKPTHGCSRNKGLYAAWCRMRKRCREKEGRNSKYYFKKGITWCAEWDNFEGFRDWAESNGYKDGLTLDRIDNNKGYSPDNCRWATYEVQAANLPYNLTNKTGYRGIKKFGKKYYPYISVRGKIKCLGGFPTAFEAHAAYEKARKERDESYLKELEDLK